MPKKESKNEFIGTSSFIQLAGVVVCFLFFPFGLISGIILLIIGSRMSQKKPSAANAGQVSIKRPSSALTATPNSRANMAKTISVDQGTIITIANLIKMTVEEVKDGQVRLTFDAPEGVSHTTDLDGSIQIYIDSVSYTFTDGYRTSQHQSLGEVLGEIIDNLQLAPDRPISVVSNAAKSPREDA